MSYIIKEVHIVYQDNKLFEVAVLWQSNERGWVRASFCDLKPISGWKFLLPNDVLSPKLIQEVAGQGFNLPDEKKKLYFSGDKKWER
jgi:hypothetical protein